MSRLHHARLEFVDGDDGDPSESSASTLAVAAVEVTSLLEPKRRFQRDLKMLGGPMNGGFYHGVLQCFTIWLFNIAMENGPFIDGLPIKNGDFP